jgi:hypothetical protein
MKRSNLTGKVQTSKQTKTSTWGPEIPFLIYTTDVIKSEEEKELYSYGKLPLGILQWKGAKIRRFDSLCLSFCLACSNSKTGRQICMKINNGELYWSVLLIPFLDRTGQNNGHSKLRLARTLCASWL